MSDSVTALVDRIAAGHQDPIRSVVDQIAGQYEHQPDAGDYMHQAGASLAKGALGGTRDLFAAPETLNRAAAGLVGPKTQAFAEGVARLTPAHWIARGLSAAASSIEDDPEVQASRPGVAKWLSTTGAGAVGQAVPFLATAGAGAAVGLTARGATALTALTGVAANGVQGFEDAERAGASPEQAFGSMLVNGGLGVLEAAEPALILARWDRRTGGMVRDTLLGAFKIDGEKGLMRAARVLGEAATEAGTEGVQQLGGNAYAGLTYDERRQLTEGLGDSVGGGGFAGALLSILTGHGPRPGQRTGEGVDLTGQSGTFADQTTGAAPSQGSPPSPTATGAAASGTTRLYRIEPTKGDAPIPTWMESQPEYQAAKQAGGRWFTDDPEEARWYLENEHPGGRIVTLDVPTADVEQYRVSKIKPTGTDNPMAHSRRPEKEFFLPKEIASRASTGTLPGSSVLSELSAANKQDVREVPAPATPEAQYVQEFAAQRGRKVRFIEGDRPLEVHGASEPGTIYVDTRAPLRSVAYHETVHQLGEEADRLADDLRKLDPEGSARFEQAYLARSRQEGLADPADLGEEGVAYRAELNAGLVYEALQRPERLRAMLESKPGAWTRIVDAVVRALQKVGLGVRTSRQRALDALRREVAGQDASKALDSETAIRVALRIRDAFETLQPRATEASGGMATVETSDALAGSETPETASQTPSDPEVSSTAARATSPALTADDYVQAIRANIDDWYADKKTEQEFNSEGARLWDEITSKVGMTTQVERALRETPRGPMPERGKPAPKAPPRMRLVDKPIVVAKTTKGATETSARAPAGATSRVVVAEMPKGAQIGTDLTGEPVYSKVERGDVARPGAGIPQPKIAQPGIFDEVGGLFEKQAYGTEDLTPPPTPSRKELLANKAVRAEFEALADEAGTEGVGGQIIRGESDNLGSGRGPVIGRTRKIAKAEWWGRRPGDTSPAHVKRAIRKALQGATLTDQEAETVDFLLYEAATRVDPDTYNANTTEAQKEREAIQNPGRNRKVPGVPFSVRPRRLRPDQIASRERVMARDDVASAIRERMGDVSDEAVGRVIGYLDDARRGLSNTNTKTVAERALELWRQDYDEMRGESREAVEVQEDHDIGQTLADMVRGHGDIEVQEIVRTIAQQRQPTKRGDRLPDVGNVRPKFSVAWHGSPHDMQPEAEIVRSNGSREYYPIGHILPDDLVREVQSGKAKIVEHPLGRFRLDKIGTGEGAQAFGYGLYFTDKREIAEHYKQKLARPNNAAEVLLKNALEESKGDRSKAADILRNKERELVGKTFLDDRAAREALRLLESGHTIGKTYEVDLAPAEDEYLLWDKPLSEQSEKVKKALNSAGHKIASDTTAPGSQFYHFLAQNVWNTGTHSHREASAYLRNLGIRGIKYLAGDGSRAKQEGTFNYVIFDPADVKVRAKFSVAPRTDSPEFKRWFGESKVVDEDGKPLVVYHGTTTPTEFSSFASSTAGSPFGKRRGIWTAEDPEEASAYAYHVPGSGRGRVFPVFLSIKNPARVRDLSRADIERLESEGYDGALIESDAGRIWVAFRPEQIKSATGNRGTFDPKNPDIRFSVAPRNSFDAPDDTRARRFNRALLDSFEALRLTPELDSAISRRPGLAYGRAERVQAQTIRGMIDVAKKVGKEKADQFLYALHAPTRNRIIAERSQGKMGEESNPGSGMTTSEARKIAAEGLKNPDLVRLRDMNRRLNRERLDALEQAGLLSKEQRAEWEKFGPDYVPLRTADDPGSRVSGGSLNVAGPESKRAEGRSTIADSPLSFGVSSFAQAVERAERNKVGQLLAKFVEDNPGKQWELIKAEPRTKDGKTTWVTRDLEQGEERLSYKVDGEQRYIYTTNPAIAAAFKQMDVAKATGVLKVAGVFRRYMHNVIIKYNPPFALSNAFRDMGTAAAKVTITDKAATGARVLKNAPAAMLGSWKAIREEGKGGEWGKWYREARDAGALVGWNELVSFQDVEQAISRSKRGAILNAIEQANRGVELGTRVALYEAMRAQGKTQEEAALISRDGTTDFARRGNYSSQLSSLYLFANANLQGTASLWRAVAAHPARGTTVLGALVAMGYLASLASRQLGDGWDDIPDYKKRRMGGVMAGGTLYGVPLPYGFDVFYYLGARAEAAANGRAQEDSLGMDVLEAAIQSFSPVQGADLLQTVTPTIGRPLVEIVTNKDFAGNPIRPQQSPFDRTPSPRSEQTFASVDPTLKAVTQGLNRATGGDSVRPGAIDVSAEDVEHVLKFLGGGLGSNAQRIITAANKWTSGEPVRKSDIPFLRTFMSEVPESAVANLYYDNLAAIEREVEARKKGEEVLDARALALATYARNVDGRVKKLRERMKASPELRPTLEPAMRAAMASLNERLAR